MEKITQEETMGCGVACVASILGISYKKCLKLFKINLADKPNFYCEDITKILNKKGLNYSYGKVTESTEKFLKKNGTIIFVKRSKNYPVGHYLLKTAKGHMDPWINMPSINPAKSGFRKKLPEKAQWVIFEK